MTDPNVSFALKPKKVFQALAFAALALAFISFALQPLRSALGSGPLSRLVTLFDVSREGNIPTWFSSSLLLICSFLLLAVTLMKRKEGDQFALHWGALAVIFLFLSLDEASSIHEWLIRPVRSALGTDGFLYYAWVVPYGVALLALALLYLGFIFALPGRTKLLFLIAGGTYTGGALGMELVGGYIFTRSGGENMAWAAASTFEELLEMLGASVFIYALLSYMIPGKRAVVISEVKRNPI